MNEVVQTSNCGWPSATPEPQARTKATSSDAAAGAAKRRTAAAAPITSVVKRGHANLRVARERLIATRRQEDSPGTSIPFRRSATIEASPEEARCPLAYASGVTRNLSYACFCATGGRAASPGVQRLAARSEEHTAVADPPASGSALTVSGSRTSPPDR